MLKGRRAEGVLEAFKAGKEIPSIKKPSDFERAWKRLHARAYPGRFVRSWTREMQGKAKHIMREVPVEEIDRLVAHVLQDWPGFCKHVRVDTGQQRTPRYPHVGFLLRHVETAINFAREEAPSAHSTPQPKRGRVYRIPAKGKKA